MLPDISNEVRQRHATSPETSLAKRVTAHLSPGFMIVTVRVKVWNRSYEFTVFIIFQDKIHDLVKNRFKLPELIFFDNELGRAYLKSIIPHVS